MGRFIPIGAQAGQFYAGGFFRYNHAIFNEEN
jgi:hypothetical protein